MEEMAALESQLGQVGRTSIVGACLRYVSICERAARICLGADTPGTLDLCLSIDERCEATLAAHCDVFRPRRDGGGVPDGRAYDGGWPIKKDAGGAPDVRPRSDSRPGGDARRRDAFVYDDASSDGGSAPWCYIGGCSAQLCSDRPGVFSTCEWRDEYACYWTATCERQPDGVCAWTPTFELQQCLATGGPKDCRTKGCSSGYSCQFCWTSYACIPYGAVC